MTKLTDEQKLERKVWRVLGRLTCCGYVDKDMQQGLQFIRKGNFIRVEDSSYIMAYNNIRNEDLADEGLDMTVDQLAEWLTARGVKKAREKRVKPFRSLYD